MRISNSLRWLVVVAGAAMLLAVAAACAGETVEVPGETVVVEKVVTETVEVPGETVVVEKEVIRTVEVPGETVTKEVVKEVMVPGETVVVKEEVIKTVEVPGQTVVKEVVKTVEVPGETVVVEKEVVKTVEVPGETVVVTKEVAVPVEVVREVPSGKNYVTDPATGKTWTAPEYGGTLTWAAFVHPPSTDNWWNLGWAPHFIGGVVERLAFADWGLSRDIWRGEIYHVVPKEATRGSLAESWSMPDDTTFIWNIRKGVYWDDKAPVNGREFDAYDVEWNYHRYFGLGDFTEDGPNAGVLAVHWGVEIESVTATDKWTVELKLTKPQLDVVGKILNSYFFVHAREQIEKYGDAKDWRNLVGTGPLRMTDFVEGSSATWEKNPNYWGFDEKFPENRLPYIDEYRSLLMPDVSARLAAMRTGKIDMLSNVGDAWIYNIDDALSLQRTNPEIEVWPHYFGPEAAFNFNMGALPPVSINDINVRKALQMSVDRETISATLFKGMGDPTPHGFMIQEAIAEGWSWPYEDWPDEVKHEYEYHPEEAEALLDAAGYPRGADGYRFKVELALYDRYDPTYAEILMGYFDAIGVDSELIMQNKAEYAVSNEADTAEWEFHTGGFGGNTGTGWNGMKGLSQNFGWSYNKAKDPRMDALYLASQETTDLEEYKSLMRQADEIVIREHWGISKSNVPKFGVSQPWVQGYFGESGMGWGERMTHLARIWIDSELKEAMGR